MFDVAPRTIIFRREDGEPIIVRASEVVSFLAKDDYVENFTEAKKVNIKRIKRKLRELLATVKQLPSLETCRDTPDILQCSSNRLADILKRRVDNDSIKI